MSNSQPIDVIWQARPITLKPVAVFADGIAAKHLLQKMVQRLRQKTIDAKAWRAAGFASENHRSVVVLGDVETLPWVDEAVWLGRSLDEPTLLLPTQRTFNIPESLVARALVMQRQAKTPIVIVESPTRIFTASAAQTVDVNVLQNFLRESH